MGQQYEAGEGWHIQLVWDFSRPHFAPVYIAQDLIEFDFFEQ